MQPQKYDQHTCAGFSATKPGGGGCCAAKGHGWPGTGRFGGGDRTDGLTRDWAAGGALVKWMPSGVTTTFVGASIFHTASKLMNFFNLHPTCFHASSKYKRNRGKIRFAPGQDRRRRSWYRTGNCCLPGCFVVIFVPPQYAMPHGVRSEKLATSAFIAILTGRWRRMPNIS